MDAGGTGETARMGAWVEVVGAGGVGETGQMSTWSEVVTKSPAMPQMLKEGVKVVQEGVKVSILDAT